MGRIFETRKTTMFARWNRMAKQFTRCAKDITIAVKAGGGDPGGNPMLRRAIANARSVNMPKDKIEAAIKRALGADVEDYQEVVYEGYAPHGVAVLVETATDNPTRTVANVRHAFSKNGGNLGSAGSVAHLFERMGVFRIDPEEIADHDMDELELELIDHGLEDSGEGTNDKGEPRILFRSAFVDFGRLQAAFEALGIEVASSTSEYVPNVTMELDDAKAEEVLKLVDKLDQDDDVQQVFHNLV
jgi:YebC/PmpR family DNA-binding regulatory protein